MNTLLVVSCMKRKVTLRQALCCRPAPVFPVAETRLRHFRKMARLLLAGNIPGESIKSPRDLIGGGRAPLPRSRRRLVGQKRFSPSRMTGITLAKRGILRHQETSKGGDMDKIVILTGAGISAESGLGTFRDEGGLWAQHRVEDVATPEGFARDPALVHRFYNARRVQAAGAAPNAAHHALARLEAEYGGNVLVVTQNVDGLHEAAGSRNVLHMHGALSGVLCAACDHRWPAPLEMSPQDTCPRCRAQAARPDIVWKRSGRIWKRRISSRRSARRGRSIRRRPSVSTPVVQGRIRWN